MSTKPRICSSMIFVCVFFICNSTLLYSQAPALLKNIRPAGSDSDPQELINVNGTLFFVANDGTNGIELWKSDGTDAGTVLVNDIHPSGSSSPQHLVCVDGIVFFMATDNVNGYELWKSDGTSAGTVMVKDIYTGALNSNPDNLTNISGVLFFTATDGINGIELWKSDGTTAGTVMVKDINPGSAQSQLQSLCNINGILFFGATDGTNGIELWKSDGTTVGTVLIKDIKSGSGNSTPGNITNVNGIAFFKADDVSNGVELWKSDGTTSGTVLVLDINTGSPNSSPNNLTDLNGALIFAATKSGQGVELWKSDGTPGGTVLLKEIRSGATGSIPAEILNVNGTAFFSANDGVVGIELWKTDGTTAGTGLLKDIKSGGAASNSSPQQFCNMNGLLYFRADDAINGIELWISDGSTAGTTMVSDIKPGATNSSPANLVAIDGVLLFQADDGTNGKELWKRVYCSGFGLAGTVGGAPVALSMSINNLPLSFFEDKSCNVIAKVSPSGSHYVNSNVTTKVIIDGSVQNFGTTPYVQRHYDIIADVDASIATATIVLYFTQAEFDAFNSNNSSFPDLPVNSADAPGKANLRITQYHGTSATGQPGTYSGVSELIDPVDTNITWNPIQSRWELSFEVTGFSGFFVHTGSFLLPVTFIHTDARIVAGVNKVSWTITEPENINYFIVERSSDGVHFIRAATQPSEQNRTQYQFAEIFTGQEKSFYRVKAILRNGSAINSRIMALAKPGGRLTLKLFPNPVLHKLYFDYESSSSYAFGLYLFSSDGKLQYHELRSVTSNGSHSVDVGFLQQGNYILQIVDNKNVIQAGGKFSIVR